jgi:hypothetical protein
VGVHAAPLRADIIVAWEAGSEAEIESTIQVISVELDFVATKSASGKAGFKVPFVSAEPGDAGMATAVEPNRDDYVDGRPSCHLRCASRASRPPPARRTDRGQIDSDPKCCAALEQNAVDRSGSSPR